MQASAGTDKAEVPLKVVVLGSYKLSLDTNSGQLNTKATVDQMAQDVSAFLVWTAEPKLAKRNQTGWPVLGFLLFATVLAYLSKKEIWRDKKGKH